MPPKITILGDASSATAAFKEARDGARSLERGTDAVSAGFGRTRIAGLKLKSTMGAFGPVAAGLVVAGQASRELSQALEVTGAAAATTQGRFSNAGAAILSGNFIGALKALATEAELSVSGMSGLVAASAKAGDQTQIDAAKAAAASVGWEKLTEQLRQVSAQATAATSEMAMLGVQAQLSAVTARTGLTGDAADAAQYGERTGRFGRGPGAAAEEASRAGGALPAVTSGLSLRLQTAIAAARAIGDKEGLIGQLQRAGNQLTKQLKQPRLTDQGRKDIFDTMSAINAEIESLSAVAKGRKAGKTPKALKAPPIIPIGLAQAAARAELTKALADDLDAYRAQDKWLGEKIKTEKDQSRKLEQLQAQGAARNKIASILEQQSRAAKDTASRIKQSALDRLDLFRSVRQNSRDLSDSTANLALQKQLGGPTGIKTATREVEDARLERQRLALQGGTHTSSGGVVININGTTLNEAQLTRAVLTALEKRKKKTSSQMGGRQPGQRPF